MTPKILLVDGDPTFTQLYSSVFRIQKINFSIAKNGVVKLNSFFRDRMPM